MGTAQAASRVHCPATAMPASPAPITPGTATACPLCGQANQCAIAAGLPPEHCWCMTAHIPAAVLAAIPSATRGQACVCPACGQAPTTTPLSSRHPRPI